MSQLRFSGDYFIKTTFSSVLFPKKNGFTKSQLSKDKDFLEEYLPMVFVGSLHYNGCKIFISSLWTSLGRPGKTCLTLGRNMQNTSNRENRKLYNSTSEQLFFFTSSLNSVWVMVLTGNAMTELI